MKFYRSNVLAMLVLSIGLVIVGLMGPAAAATDDTSDVMAMLTEKLKLTPEQVKKLKPEVDKFVTTLDQLKADQEKEGADPQDLVHGAKKAQEDYLKAVEQILTPEQYKQYNALKEQAVRSMFNSLADIQLMDLQPKVGFSDEQLEKLVPVVGDALFQVIHLAWEHAGKRLRVGQKIRLAEQLKHIQKDTHGAVSKILTPEQLKTWDSIKEQAQQQQKS